MTIRFAKVTDDVQIISLLDELIHEVNKRGGFSPKLSKSYDDRKKIFVELLKRDDVKIFVAEENEKVYAVADVFFFRL